eukprot:2173962-Pleurochrysis_carterae.AAC.1
MSSVTHLFPACVAFPLIHYLLPPSSLLIPLALMRQASAPYCPGIQAGCAEIVGLPSAPLLPFLPPAFAVRRAADDGGALAGGQGRGLRRVLEVVADAAAGESMGAAEEAVPAAGAVYSPG